MSDAIISVDAVRKSYGGVRAVDDASFDVERGSLTALIGPNGAGKSTMFSIITGFVRPDAGSVLFDDRRIDAWPSYRIARAGLVRTFQLTSVFGGMSVLENLLVGFPSHRGRSLTGALLRHRARRVDERNARRRALDLLTLLRLDGVADHLGAELSGGQRKLVELARVLMLEPTVVLLDEPMAGVNPSLGAQLLEHVQRLREDRGTTFLFVEHDMDVVATHADRVIVMASGAVVADGDPASVLRADAVVSAYLGTT